MEPRETQRKTDERRGRKPAGKGAERQREAEGERDRNKRGKYKERQRQREKQQSEKKKKKRIKIKAETKAETSKHIQRMRMIRWKHRDYKGNQSLKGEQTDKKDTGASLKGLLRSGKT